MTSSLLSLLPFMTFILKWKSFPFSLPDESLLNVFLITGLCTVWLSTLQTNSFLFSVSRPNEVFRGHPGPRTEFLRYLDFLPGDISLYQPYRYVPPRRVCFFFLRFFGLLKTVHTLLILVWNRVWFSRELPECKNVFVVSIPNEEERKRKMRILWHNFCREVWTLEATSENRSEN